MFLLNFFVPGPKYHLSLTAGDTKKQPHLGADPNKRASCFGLLGGGGSDHHPKKPDPSAVQLVLASFLGVIVLLATNT